MHIRPVDSRYHLELWQKDQNNYIQCMEFSEQLRLQLMYLLSVTFFILCTETRIRREQSDAIYFSCYSFPKEQLSNTIEIHSISNKSDFGNQAAREVSWPYLPYVTLRVCVNYAGCSPKRSLFDQQQ